MFSSWCWELLVDICWQRDLKKKKYLHYYLFFNLCCPSIQQIVIRCVPLNDNKTQWRYFPLETHLLTIYVWTFHLFTALGGILLYCITYVCFGNEYYFEIKYLWDSSHILYMYISIYHRRPSLWKYSRNIKTTNIMMENIR